MTKPKGGDIPLQSFGGQLTQAISASISTLPTPGEAGGERQSQAEIGEAAVDCDRNHRHADEGDEDA